MKEIQKIKYNAKIQSLPKEVPKEKAPETVLNILKDVRCEIGKISPDFNDLSLTQILGIVTIGEYSINGNMPVHFDLTSAREIMIQYRENSKRWCGSCHNLTTDMSQSYADFQDYGPQQICSKGFTNSNVCGSNWRPYCSPPLEQLVENAENSN